MKQNKRRSKRGTSLIECVLALTMFTILSVMVAMMLSTASILQRKSTDTDQAANQVGDQAELAVMQPIAATDGVSGQLAFAYENGNAVATRPVRFVEYTQAVQGSTGAGSNAVTIWRMGVPTVPPAGP